MTEFKGEISVVILAPAQAVYDYLADFTRHPEWVKNVTKVEQITPGPAGVGARYRAAESSPPAPLGRMLRAMLFFVQGMLGGASAYSEAEITALEPGRRIAWIGRVTRPTGDFNRSEWEVVLEPQGNATRLVQRFRYLPQTEAARNMLGALGDEAGIAAGSLVNLNRLKARLDQAAPQAA